MICAFCNGAVTWRGPWSDLRYTECDRCGRKNCQIVEAVEVELPDGICEASGGGYEAVCCMCDEWRPIYCGIDEIPMTGYRHYCGGSPRCCP